MLTTSLLFLISTDAPPTRQFEKIITHIENGKLRGTYASTMHYKMVDGKLYRFNEKTS